MNKQISSILFVTLLLAVSYYYGYHKHAFKRPQSVHKWRQSDCASIALNYYQGGMNFFYPETHNLTSDKGTSSKCCTSEIPILYYTVAAFYSVFGYHEYIYRIFNTLLFFLGLFYLYRLFYFLLKDSFWAVTLSILFFTSPVLIFYANNFLSNSSALAFSMVAWYYFVRFLFDRKPKWFYFSIAVFLIAGALKVTAFFSLFAIAGILVLEYTGLIKSGQKGKIFDQPIKYLVLIFLVVLIVGSWLIYAKFYNQKHDCTYFSTTTFPVWNLDKVGILKVMDRIQNIWLAQYFHYSVLVFLGVSSVFLILTYKKNNTIFNLSILLILIEIVLFVTLQFWTFADHDYYTIGMYIFPIILVMSTFYVLKNSYTKIFNSLYFKIAFAAFLLFNIYYGQIKNSDRYNGWMNDYKDNKDIYSITPFLRQQGISPNDTVISIPDVSHVSLYLMNQKGWTEYTDARFNSGNMIRYNQSNKGIERSINNGARYLIIKGIEEIYKKPYLQEFCFHLIGNFNNALVFNLKADTKNFNLNERRIKNAVSCGAEQLSSDKQFFVDTNDSVIIRNGNTQSGDFSRSGIFSSRLYKDSPYGMTIYFEDLKQGESFKISVWRKTAGEKKGGIVASNSTNTYYNNQYDVVEKDAAGWEKLEMEFFVPKELEEQDIGIYLYNPNQELNYFDDFQIIWYESVLNEI